MDITKYLKAGSNIVTVSADNRFSPDMLPVNRSLDWAMMEDYPTGGTVGYRKAYIKTMTVTSRPVITTKEERQDEGLGIFGIEVEIGQPEQMENLQLEWQIAEAAMIRRK